MFDSNSIYLMLIASVVTPALTAFSNEILRLIRTLVDKLIAYILGTATKKANELVSMPKAVPIPQVTISVSENSRGTKYGNMDLIRSILTYLNDKGVVSSNNNCNLLLHSSDFDSRNTFSSLNRGATELIPLTELEYKQYNVLYSERIDEASAIRPTLTIQSVKGINKIRRFMTKCMKKYVTTYLSIPEPRKIFMHVNSTSTRLSDDALSFKNVIMQNSASFDKLFFPEKDHVLRLADKIMNGKINKLSLLLHGLPGCGKTSIIKAMANYLDCSIMIVKLSLVQTDTQLLSLFHDNGIAIQNYGVCNIANVKRIYVFEDIDAECDVVHTRKESDEHANYEDDKPPKAEDVSKLTLSGILNALDGIIELHGVIIMTTNHIKKLDPALIRPGRVSRIIEMKKMTCHDAHALIEHHFGPHNIHVPDGELTPATLASICESAISVEEVQTMIDAL